MSSSGPNPVLAPVRRWVLYSRTNLAIAVAGSVAVLFVAGAVFGEDPQPQAAAHAAPAAIAPAAIAPAASAETVRYDLDEVSESQVVAKTADWVDGSAPATAMAYAHAFVDTTASDTKWASAVGRYTSRAPGEDVVAARPRTPVVITGPTSSTRSDSPDGRPGARVTVPTQAGDLRISLTVDVVAGGKRFTVDAPLPTLDLTEVAKTAPAPATTAQRAPAATTTAAEPTRSPAPATSTTAVPGPTLDLDDPAPTTNRQADPVPVPGPIPIPELDTPIPGER
ncbi:hypothetical protein GCM10023094_55110 [Rhodococcus olei]|uniref:Uncharacterized protein n=1 Tax=Rhodococcus olei TaxID=2161675 RepID=A0ABP8PTS8_9NOCA